MTETQMIIRDYCEQLHTSKLDKSEEMHQFLEAYNLQWLNHEETKPEQINNEKEHSTSDQKPPKKEQPCTCKLHAWIQP